MLVIIVFRPVSILYHSLTSDVTEHSREVLLSLGEKHIKLTENQTNIVNIKKYASDLQTCVAVKQIEKEAETQYPC
jgi:hypothetical protein